MSTKSWPNRKQSKAAGCTCNWYRDLSILDFDPGCPILDQHKRSNHEHREAPDGLLRPLAGFDWDTTLEAG